MKTCCLFIFRRERQRSFLPVVHLRGHGSRRSRDGHVGGSGVGHRPGLWSPREGEIQQQLVLSHLRHVVGLSVSLFLHQVEYVILKDASGDSQFFSIDSHNGVIVTRASFDREQKASYLIEVQSQDSSESARPGQQGQPNTGNTTRHTTHDTGNT